MFSKLRSKRNNSLNVSAFILKNFSVKYTIGKLKEILEDHIDYPSILSLKDVLGGYGIQSTAIRKGAYSYCDFETPFVCNIQRKKWPSASFTVVIKNDNEIISYLDPSTNNITNISLSEFEQIDKGIILLLDDSKKEDEVNFSTNKTNYRAQSLIRATPLYFSLIIYLISILLLFAGDSKYPWIGLGFLTSSFIGLGLTLLLMWHEVDAHNPFLKEICGGVGKKTNCDAILNSSKSKFLGISWTIWGFSFMATLFLVQISFENQMPFLLISSAMSIIAIPFIIFSIYYQSRAKQWCPLCLGILLILALNSLFAIIFLNNESPLVQDLTYHSVSIVCFLGLLFLVIAYYTVPILKKALDSDSYKQRWRGLRYNPEIFQALLNKSSLVTYPATGLGVVVGNLEAPHEIIKVCNPYCGPCSKAHTELEELIKTNPNIKLRIIFTASGEDKDAQTAPVAHLLAIQEKHGELILKHALDEWYTSPDKDYATFSSKYPMNGQTKEQKEKIAAMRNWCNNMKIRVTPTIFINGRELPDSYTVKELKNLF